LALSAHPDSDLESTRAAPWLEDLWDRHGRAVYTLACALLGDETAAAQAVRLGMTDLAHSAERASTNDAHRSWARHVYVRSQEIADETSRISHSQSAMTSLGQLPLPQRTCLALCLYGGHTCREVASLLGVPHLAVADLLTTGLRDVERLAGGGTAAHA